MSNRLSSVKSATNEPGRLWFRIGIAAVAGIALTAGWALYLEQKSFLTLRHTYELIITTDELMSNLTDAESGALGYVLTADSRYLRMYSAARRATNAPMDKLGELVSDEPTQRARVQALAPLIQQSLAEIAAGLHADEFRATNSAAQPKLTVLGTSLMERARQIIQDMQDGEQMALAQFSMSRQSRLQAGGAALIGSAFLASACMILGRALLNRNVSCRQKAEEELRISEKRFEILCDQAPIGIYETDPSGGCVYANPQWSKITGLSEDDSLGHGWEEVIYPNDRAMVLQERKKAASDGAPWEYRLMNARGELRWIRSFSGPIYSTTGELTGYVDTVEDVTERKQAERALNESRQELRSLTGRLINAEDEERKRISRDLHDDLGQRLALLAFDAGSLLVASSPDGPFTDRLHDFQQRVVQLAQDVRKISHRLHPSILEDLGLISALKDFCDELSSREGMDVEFEHHGVPRALPLEIASCLFLVTQEALHNVQKHASTSHVKVTIQGSPEGIHLSIHDSGVGFDSESPAFHQGLGIVSMKERVRLVQGEFCLDSKPGDGVEVNVFVPLERKDS